MKNSSAGIGLPPEPTMKNKTQPPARLSLPSLRRALPALAGIVAVGVLAGCASTPRDPRDPLEPLNRATYRFNDAVDKALLKPTAQAYRTAAPLPVRTGVANFFSNLNDVLVAANNLLQGKGRQGASDIGRVLINSTAGILGFIDVATPMGLPKHNEDFGQTLAKWGMGDGPYLMLPLLGPSTFRDAVGIAVDHQGDLPYRLGHVATRNEVIAGRVVSRREGLLDSEKVLNEAAIDRYEFLRDAYLERRRSLVYDGSPPLDDEDDEDLDGNAGEAPKGSAAPAEGLTPKAPSKPSAPEPRSEAAPMHRAPEAAAPSSVASGEPAPR